MREANVVVLTHSDMCGLVYIGSDASL